MSKLIQCVQVGIAFNLQSNINWAVSEGGIKLIKGYIALRFSLNEVIGRGEIVTQL